MIHVFTLETVLDGTVVQTSTHSKLRNAKLAAELALGMAVDLTWQDRMTEPITVAHVNDDMFFKITEREVLD